MESKIKNFRIIVGSIVAILITIILLIIILTSPQSARERLPFSSLSPKLIGSKALALLLEERGYLVQEWEKTYDQLPSITKSTLFTIEPNTPPPSSDELNQIIQWVEKGNQWILFATPETRWNEALGFQIESCYSGRYVQVARDPNLNNPWLNEIRALDWGQDCVKPTIQDKSLLRRISGKSMVVVRQQGEGRIVYIPYSQLLVNERIAQVDNIALPLGLLEDYTQHILFDETVHPLLPRIDQSNTSDEEVPEFDRDFSLSSFFSMIQLNGILVILQLFVAVVFWVWWKGKRFAPARRESHLKMRAGDEHVIAMGRWLKRHSSRKELLNYVFQKLRRDIQSTLSLPQTIKEEQLLESIEKKIGSSFAHRFKISKNQLDDLNNKRIVSEKDYLSLINTLVELRKEIDQWKNKLGPLKTFNKFPRKSFKH